MITRITESKTIRKQILCTCKCKFAGRKFNAIKKWNNNKCLRDCKNLKEHPVCEKDYIWNSDTCDCKNGEYLASIIDGTVINAWWNHLNAADVVSTNIVSTVSTNVTIAASINFYNQKLRYKIDCYILHTVYHKPYYYL